MMVMVVMAIMTVTMVMILIFLMVRRHLWVGASSYWVSCPPDSVLRICKSLFRFTFTVAQ